MSDKIKEGEPLHFNFTFVQCEKFRCLAYLDKKGVWRNWMNHQVLPKVIKVIGDSPDGLPSCF